MDNQERAQWALHVVVWHGPRFGHRISIETQRQGCEPLEHSGGYWKGIGIPEEVLTGVLTVVYAILQNHLVTRYGIQGELDLRWGGEPEPF